MTDWRGGDGGPASGMGQRLFLVGRRSPQHPGTAQISSTPAGSGGRKWRKRKLTSPLRRRCSTASSTRIRTTRERPESRNQVLRELKQSVCRDLENLLNTPSAASRGRRDLDELKRSLVTYGIPDIRAAEARHGCRPPAIRPRRRGDDPPVRAAVSSCQASRCSTTRIRWTGRCGSASRPAARRTGARAGGVRFGDCSRRRATSKSREPADERRTAALL